MVTLPKAGRSGRFRRLLAYLRPHQTKIWGGIVALFIVNLLGTYLPLLIGTAVDELQAKFDLQRVVFYALLLIGLASLMWLIRMASRLWIFGAGRLVEFDLKQRLFEHLLRLEPSYFAENTPGDLISRATSDVDNIRRLVGFALLSAANTVFAYGMTLPVMLAIHPGLSLGAIAVYPAVLFIVQTFSDRLRAEQLDVQQSLAELSDLIQEDMSGIALIKIYGQEANEQRQFDQLNQDLLRNNLVLAKTRNILFPLLGGMVSFSLLILLWFGSRMIAANTIQVGDFIALLLYIERLIFPTALLGFTITTYQRGEVSIDRIEAILSVEPRITDAPDAIALPRDRVQGHLRCQNLTFTYPNRRTPALNQLSFEIQAGEMVAIVGPIGCGKSTLASALPRLLEIAPNQIFLDGIDITQLRLADLRGAIAYVPQESFLFSTTIKNNIRYGEPDATELKVIAAASQAQIHNEILNFPKQYDTLVGERGITLSGGQRQRTALARALLVDAPILVLDDALASVDNQTASQILQTLRQQQRTRTVLFISHQLSAAATCDRILVMDQGRIVQQGTHDELVAAGGLYQSLWQQYQLESSLG
ncbi:ABC transporter ATP-binding protein [Thermosynechococcus sp. JY1334]|uniref:ABC transporter ATP-binding protein n=1 Tax=unclassified Thermosynechococcus TaxID=2622553 RepID=UPI002671219F|nr:MULTISPECIES: ABC transporter ATP-binding protein [unclassified Thermosynechococcus]MDR7897109.1 ABC transporter ATP-binding protein [Thermosynechococcus sp. JY1332]MDR7904507.1 ABC transporter ATP-binding protein [Thermosynechococcus sp. JY1334]WKT86746.1 ABC transporter ATP-binding protein [Thermosynechococcus sp. JY1339]WNC55690.1 ABC transporter ATP-binding protein [Thermosynechococcus sp. JY1331]